MALFKTYTLKLNVAVEVHLNYVIRREELVQRGGLTFLIS